jgi:hypothetical protein
MLVKLFLLPLFLHVVLIFWVGTRLLRARVKAIRGGSAKMSEIAIDSSAWPRKVRLLGNNFDNQFDTPVLWYAVTALVVALQMVDLVFITLSWIYILTRYAHSIAHTGNNHVPSRMRIFLFGFFSVGAMWTWMGIQLFLVRSFQ